MEQPPPEHRESEKPATASEAQEDTEAILSRRSFLIKSALSGAGVAATACGPKPSPHPCLSEPPMRRDAAAARPRREIAVPPKTSRDAGAEAPLRPPKPHPCLSPPKPQPCLKIKPRRTPKRRKPRGRICLSDFSVEGELRRPKKKK